jgi:hypothetical protein
MPHLRGHEIHRQEVADNLHVGPGQGLLSRHTDGGRNSGRSRHG